MAGAVIRSRVWGSVRIARTFPFPFLSPLCRSFSIAALASLPGCRKGSSFFLQAAYRKTKAWQHLPQLAIVNTRGLAAKGKKRKPLEGENPGNEKEAALQAALDQIASTFGKETVMWLGRNAGPRFVPVISTGSLGLDVALGIGGLPKFDISFAVQAASQHTSHSKEQCWKGRVVEIYGPEASGKTTLALHCIAEAQKFGGYCVFIDAEHALDYALAEAIGVKTENLLLAQPDCCEQALNLTDTFIRSGSIDIIVVDSVAALVPRAELDGEMGDSHMALQARLMSQALRKLAHALSRSQTILIFINQTRSKLNTFGFGGPVEVTSGGNALKFYASLRLNIRRIKLIQKGEEAIGSLVNVKVVKNKLAPPFKTAEFEIEFGKGISKEGEIIDQAVKLGLLGKNGGWYSYKGVNIANGKENLKAHLREHEELRESLACSIKENLMGHHDEVDEHEDPTEEGSDQEYKQVIVNIDEYDNMAVGGDQ